MCGIAGLIDFKKNISDRGLTQEAGIMNETLKHRGPDAGAVWTDPGSGVALAHRRLSILDLSPTGAQPMHSEAVIIPSFSMAKFIILEN